MWLFDLFFSQFCKSDMSRYGYNVSGSISESPLDFGIMRVDCILAVREGLDQTAHADLYGGGGVGVGGRWGCYMI